MRCRGSASQISFEGGAVVAAGMAMPATAQAQDKQATPPLVQLLQSKGILSPDEAAQLSAAGSADEANARL